MTNTEARAATERDVARRSFPGSVTAAARIRAAAARGMSYRVRVLGFVERAVAAGASLLNVAVRH